MYGRFSDSGIVAITNHAEALKRWEGIKPIRGRAKDERPIGRRNKNYMQIRKNDDGSMTCVLYTTDVVTFYPDNKVRVHVPAMWRSNTTAKFIEAVFGSYRVSTAVRDNDVIMAVKGGDARYLRVGENTIFEVGQGGSLKLLSNDRVHTVLSIDRKQMNAARKTIAPFLKYLSGVVKLRDGVFPLEQAQETVNYLVEQKKLAVGSPAAREWYTRADWDLDVPTSNWRDRNTSTEAMIEKYKLLADRAMHGDLTEWNHLVCWVAMSAGTYFGKNDTYHVSLAAAKKAVDHVLMALNPSIFIEAPEARDAIQVNRYRHFGQFIKFAKEHA